MPDDSMQMPQANHACSACCPPQPQDAWNSRQSSLERGSRLIDESHLGIGTLHCLTCGQRHVPVFTERLTGQQVTTLSMSSTFPSPPAEEAALLRANADDIPKLLVTYGRGRRTLEWDFPSGDEAHSCWGAGFALRPHD